MDRRVRKTKQALSNSLMELLEVKGLDKITVKELCDHADINKSTFYLHYHDIYDLIEQIEAVTIDELAKVLSTEIDQAIKQGDFETLFKELCIFIKGYSPFSVAMFISSHDFENLKSLLLEKCLMPLKHHIEEQSKVPFDFFYTYTVAGIIAIISKWAADDMKESEEEIGSYCTAMFLGGINLS